MTPQRITAGGTTVAYDPETARIRVVTDSGDDAGSANRKRTLAAGSVRVDLGTVRLPRGSPPVRSTPRSVRVEYDDAVRTVVRLDGRRR